MYFFLFFNSAFERVKSIMLFLESSKTLAKNKRYHQQKMNRAWYMRFPDRSLPCQKKEVLAMGPRVVQTPSHVVTNSWLSQSDTITNDIQFWNPFAFKPK